MKNRSLVLLSGESTTLPEAEARALFLAYDPGSTFSYPERGLLIAESEADPVRVGRRVAFARRVGLLSRSLEEAAGVVGERPVRFRSFSLAPGRAPPDPVEFLDGLDLNVNLAEPEVELTLVRGSEDYVAVTDPLSMKQGWAARRPRARPYFHPTAIFPKLARALFNLTRCLEGQVFLDPFAGTGSLAMEASVVGAEVVAWDQTSRMAAGALANMRHFRQGWLGVLRADTFSPPIRSADAVATDVPYGRASSTRGLTTRTITDRALEALTALMPTKSRLVLMHPLTMEVRDTPGYAVEEEHHLHVHKLLTRTITVLRRK